MSRHFGFRRWAGIRFINRPRLAGALLLAIAFCLFASAACADTWTGAAQSPANQTRSWNIGGNWALGVIPPANDNDQFNPAGEGTINLNGIQSAGIMNFANFSNYIIATGAGPSTLNMMAPAAGVSAISLGEGVRDTYGVDYFTEGPQFTADVALNAPLSLNLGLPAGGGVNSAMMFSGQISSTVAGNIINYNGFGEGTGWWITSNNSFAGGMTIKIVDGGGGSGGSSTGYTLHLVQRRFPAAESIRPILYSSPLVVRWDCRTTPIP